MVPKNAKGTKLVIESFPGEIDVRLEEAPTTGYRWQMERLPEAVTIISDDFVQETTELVVGGSGTRVLRLRIDEPGIYRINFRLKRPWEAKEIEERMVEIRVTPISDAESAGTC